jgi:predicted ATPase/class 3 adenylate cyclase
MRCSKCGAENPDRAKFCVECALPFMRRCPSCNTDNPSTAKFCLECAKPLNSGGKSPSVAEPATSPIQVTGTADASLDGERKTVTTLFADIKGSMELIEDLDPEEARAVVDPALKLMMESVRRYGGYVAQSTGDGIFALFGAPIAHEDHTQRALYAALRMQEELKRYSDRIRAEGRLPIQARVGVNTGEVVVRSITTGEGRAEYAPVGHSTGIAARMQALAPVGSIAATETIRKHSEGYFLFKSLGPTRVKGVSEPVNVYEVTGLGPLRTRLQRAAARGYTKFVGREREMEVLSRTAEQAKTGHGQIVAAMAEPGVGKSRLFYEFKTTSQSGWMLLEAVSLSHDKASAYMPVVDLLTRYFDIEAEDDGRKRREKVAGKIAILDRALEDTLPYLYGLLGLIEGNDPLAGMDAPIRRQRTLEALKRILLRESFNQPLMVIFEDLHWIDDDTQAFLNLLADSIGTARLLLLVNYRPEYSHQWNSKTYYTQLRLDPLGGDSAGEMFDALLGVRVPSTDDSLAALKRLIIEKAEGTPLFMEEVVQALIEEGALVRNGVMMLTRSLDTLKIPPTVQDILASRIDRLPAAERELLQTLAVIGSEFPVALARELIKKPEDELTRMLNALQLAEFIYEQPAVGGVEYTFKHALTREVAYGSLLTERRKRLHQHAGVAIESLFAEHLDDHVSDLAHHFIQSGNATKAVRYLILAGKQAFERSAFTESQVQLQRGLEWVKRVPDEAEGAKLELELLLGSEQTLRYAAGVGGREVADVMRRADELCKQVGTDAQRFLVLLGMQSVLASSGDYEAASEKCRLALELAGQAHDLEMLQTATGLISITLYQSGRLAEALQQSRRALELTQLIQEKRSSHSVRAEWIAKSITANSLLLLGYPEQAERAAGEALATVGQMTLPTALLAGQALVNIYLYLRMPKVAHAFAEEGVAAAERSGLAFLRVAWRGRLGAALAQDGNPEKGLAMVRDALHELNFFQDRLGAVVVSWIEALGIAGRHDEAIAEADKFFRSNFPRMLLAYVYLLKGEAVLARHSSVTAEAEKCFRKAIEVALGQSAKWWELRATVNLARLLAKQGRRDEARVMLAEIYNWFTEGFDTADLRDAKELLEELSNSPR